MPLEARIPVKPEFVVKCRISLIPLLCMKSAMLTLPPRHTYQDQGIAVS